MAIVTGDRYLDNLVKFVDKQAGPLLDGTLVLKLNPVGLHYVQSRLEALQELEALKAGAPVDYLRAYISDLGDHRALEQLRRILRLLTSLKVVSILPTPARDPTPLSLLPFGRLKLLELRGCDLSTSPARGLLQLRHTLEKIIVHNSTDALRHVFTSRIADINTSPVWNKLSLVSCPCNGLVLMDESLQLLPSVETLDLSRNRFAKVDNLRKCTKLKHLDLGFNHLRSISYLGEVTFPIVKLVLRNNALTSLRGIETLKSVEGLDLSYNVISSILELEILSSLPFLQSLWLEGNPICCAPWYRAQVFSLFAFPEKLKLDEKGITTRESWKRQIVLASRLKRPAGFGFYYPAKDNDEEEGNVNTNKKKLSRLALIADEEQMRCVAFEAVEQDSVSCESEIRSREESAVSDGEAEIVNLMNRVEFMKKEHSVLWLREFKEWMDQTSENFVDNSKLSGPSGPREENYMKNKKDCHQIGQSSRYASGTLRASGDESNTNLLESDTSFGDSSIGLHAFEGFNSVNDIALEPSIANGSEDPGSHFIIGDINLKQVPKVCSQEQHNCLSVAKDSNPSDSLVCHEDVKIDKEISTMSVTAIDEKIGSHSSSAHPGSPPHYEEDILHRRHNLEEEFMQLSVDSYSLASSDSDTSVSDDELFQFDTFSPEVGRLQHGESNKIMDDQSEVLYFEEGDFDTRHDAPHIRQNGRSLFTTCDDKNSTIKEHLNENHIDNPDEQAYATGSGIGDYDEQNSGGLEKTKRNRRLKRRIVALAEENGIVGSTKLLSQKHNGIAKAGIADMEDILRGGILDKNSSQNFYDNDCNIEAESQLTTDEVIKNYFHENVADSSVSEDYLQSILCDCMLQKDSECKESKVVILLSSANKVYMLLLDATPDGSGVISEVVGSHRLEDIQRVDIGIALQVLRVHIKVDTTYLFMTKSVKKTREILSLLHVSDSTAMSNRCSLNSVEKVQVELFEKHICGGSNISIFLYSMLLFWCNKNEEESWVPRSLFVIEGYMIVCVEDLVHFSFDAVEDAFPNTYFSLDSCCPISDISEMVIEPSESRCVTLTLDSEKCNSPNDFQKEKVLTKLDNKFATGSCQWKFKWFSEEILLKFVALLKALHAETASYPLAVRCMP